MWEAVPRDIVPDQYDSGGVLKQPPTCPGTEVNGSTVDKTEAPAADVAEAGVFRAERERTKAEARAFMEETRASLTAEEGGGRTDR